MVRLASPAMVIRSDKTYTSWPTDRKIRYLEYWHRNWEIANTNKIVHPTFASEHDLNHPHRWSIRETQPISGITVSWECLVCWAVTFDDPADDEETEIVTNAEYDQAREDKWAELINLVNIGDINIREANDRFDRWAAEIKVGVSA